jgi:uncharacterized SAM-dependent methyltransferase
VILRSPIGGMWLFSTLRSHVSRCISKRGDRVKVRWPGGERAFVAGERIHTENSYKWRAEDFTALLERCGIFRRIRCWTDERGWFAVFLAQA